MLEIFRILFIIQFKMNLTLVFYFFLFSLTLITIFLYIIAVIFREIENGVTSNNSYKLISNNK